MKHIAYSKIFVLSFITLVFGTCAIPFFQAIFNTINEILLMTKFYFFYQLHFNLHLLLLEQILPTLILCWLFFEFAIHPCIVKLHFSRTFKTFILTKILKKEIDFFTLNKKERYIKKQESKYEKNDDTNSQKISIKTAIQYNTNRWGLKNKKINLFYKNSNLLRHFFNILKSMFSTFSINHFRRGNF
ncbi:MAG: hypothetical protein ACFFDN_20220 [Candidatus Hodarchaeota archaeon]